MVAIPLAWLQLMREKTRLLVALAGIGFAVILMFMQLGFQDALFESAINLHKNLQGDIFLINPQSTALIAMQSFSQRRLFQSLSYPEVESVSSIYLDLALWRNPETRGTRSILILGIQPDGGIFNLPGIQENIKKIQIPDVVLFDENSRAEFGPIPQQFRQGKLVQTEVFGRRVTVGGLFKLGASFGADGNVITSDLNFRRIFTSRQPGLIDVGVIKLKPGSNINGALAEFRGDPPTPKESQFDRLLKSLNLSKKQLWTCQDFLSSNRDRPYGLPKDICVLSKDEFMEFERSYWANGTAIGFIFPFGTAMGFIVGTVIVYQILYTDVMDHLTEYATLKAMGYTNLYLLSVVFQEAFILSILGYFPALLLCIGLYDLTNKATFLPIFMTTERALVVLLLSIFMCVISGAIAVRKVQAADPADIF
ncbi:MAG: FtsX-like permease family protein [Cyanobacteria bacterium WB6_1B_304]|jgi:putative ABC transport system permease protein|nr:FtsX-like permease family protein [Cyanobacteria bacterium WB6_1B_304]